MGGGGGLHLRFEYLLDQINSRNNNTKNWLIFNLRRLDLVSQFVQALNIMIP